MARDKFYIKMSSISTVTKGTILTTGIGELEVIKVYRDNWFKKLLRRVNIKLRINQVKVKMIGEW